MEPDWIGVCLIIVDQISLIPLDVLYTLYTILIVISLHSFSITILILYWIFILVCKIEYTIEATYVNYHIFFYDSAILC